MSITTEMTPRDKALLISIGHARVESPIVLCMKVLSSFLETRVPGSLQMEITRTGMRRFRLHSFHAIAQVAMMMPPQDESFTEKLASFSLDMPEFMGDGVWGSYPGYET